MESDQTNYKALKAHFVSIDRVISVVIKKLIIGMKHTEKRERESHDLLPEQRINSQTFGMMNDI
jgi:hypothetical protein